MFTSSPLIQNGDLVLSNTGNLEYAADVVTQMTVTVAAYNCIYDYSINSGLIPYLSSIPVGGRNPNTIVNIVAAAYQSLISAGIITGLQVAIVFQSASYITINITATDANGSPVVLSWSNLQ